MRYLDIFKYKKTKYSLYIFLCSYFLSLLLFPLLVIINKETILFTVIYYILKVLSVPLCLAALYFVLILLKSMSDPDFNAESSPEKFSTQIYQRAPIIYNMFIMTWICLIVLHLLFFNNIINLDNKNSIAIIFINEFLISSTIVVLLTIGIKFNARK